ncbi:phosphatase PAP2 family protein [soil metagenome]
MPTFLIAYSPFWHAVTRLGEAQVMLPAALALLLWLAHRPAARLLVGWWLGMMVLATSITTATKIAFIGYGFGWAPLNFTGISGHAMFAAVVYPLLFLVLALARPVGWQRAALAAGYLLALLVGISRVMVGAHSPSEVIAGLLLGGAASAAAITIAHTPAIRMPVWLPLGVIASVLVLGVNAPPSRTHDLVTRISLALSGRSAPYTRREMLRTWQQQQRGSQQGTPVVMR